VWPLRKLNGNSLKPITQADVVDALGEPDEIVTRTERMTSRRWVFSAY
jgi:hypothetical protein